jgi:CRISPR-associated endonuclease Cas1
VITLIGYGIQVLVERGHLVLRDGIGVNRRRARLPRVRHGLRRLIVVGSDGMVSLAALRWLADQGAAFVMLERDGKVLAVTGPVRPSDSKLRRAQALAHSSGSALRIAREIIDRKLAGQEEVARHKLRAPETADIIHRFRSELAEADSPQSIRLIESQGAKAYWSAWQNLPIIFPRKDTGNVPDHWRVFGARVSPLTGSPRLAVNPPNAILNYLYALLESESRLAITALGLDPGLGVLHVDAPNRDSLACDVMECVRPQVDAFVLGWIVQEPLKRDWFFEQRDGNCRLMAALTVTLSETGTIWARAVAPHAEWIAKTLWSESSKKAYHLFPPTRLTQHNKRATKDDPAAIPLTMSPPRRENLCRGCGKTIQSEHLNCAGCAVNSATERLVSAARLGRLAARSPEARAKHVASRKRHAQASSAWDPSAQPAWLTDQLYSQTIQPLVALTSGSVISQTIGVSRWYAGRIRKGYYPHPRHWFALAKLVGVGSPESPDHP